MADISIRLHYEYAFSSASLNQLALYLELSTLADTLTSPSIAIPMGEWLAVGL